MTVWWWGVIVVAAVTAIFIAAVLVGTILGWASMGDDE